MESDDLNVYQYIYLNDNYTSKVEFHIYRNPEIGKVESDLIITNIIKKFKDFTGKALVRVDNKDSLVIAGFENKKDSDAVVKMPIDLNWLR